MTARHRYLFAALVGGVLAGSVLAGCTLYTNHGDQGNGCNFGTCGPDAGQIPPPDAPCGGIFCIDAGCYGSGCGSDGGGCNGFGCGSDAGGGGGSDGGCGGGSDGGNGSGSDGGGCMNCYPDAGVIIPPDAP